MVNIKKLKGKIVEKGLTVAQLAVAIKIDPATLYRRLNDKGNSFTIGEVNRIVSELSLTTEEATNIFFDTNVA